MRKYIIIGMIAAAALMAGCKKSGEPLPGKDTVVPEGAMLFSVKMDGFAAKSHFDPATEEEEIAKLVWDNDDDISVMAVKVPDSWEGDIMQVDFSQAKSCRAVIIPSSISGGSATFTAVDAADDWWKADGDTDEDSKYIFSATYPARGKVLPIEVLLNASFEDEGVTYNFKDFSQFLEIPADQDGKSYNKYQSLMDVKLDDPFTYKELDEKSRMIRFTSFQPSTSLLHFRLVSGDDNAITGVHHIKLSYRLFTRGSIRHDGMYTDPETHEEVNYPTRYYYYVDEEMSTYLGMAGKGFIPFFSQFFHDDSYALVMMNMSMYEGYGITIHEGLTNAQSITLTPKTGSITIPKTLAESEEFYVVTAALPLEFIGSSNSAVVYFEAFDANNNLIAVSEKTMPSEGFLSGIRYNFNLAMGKPLNIDGVDAGGYDGIIELTQ